MRTRYYVARSRNTLWRVKYFPALNRPLVHTIFRRFRGWSPSTWTPTQVEWQVFAKSLFRISRAEARMLFPNAFK